MREILTLEDAGLPTPPINYVLLAAGLGNRMGDLTKTQPKVLIEVAGQSIVAHNLDAIATVSPQSNVTLVTGHHSAAIDSFAAARRAAGFQISTVFNPDYATGGPLRSIEVALAGLPRDCDSVTIGNGDTIFEVEALRVLVSSDAPASLLTSFSDYEDDDDVQVEIAGGVIVRAAKRLGPKGSLPISAGLLQLRGPNTIGIFRMLVAESVVDELKLGKQRTWHSIIQRLAIGGLPSRPILTPHASWWEFDSDLSLRQHAARHPR